MTLKVLVALSVASGLVLGCVQAPILPPSLAGQAALVLGYTADLAVPYQGGMLYTGLRLERLNGEPISNAPMKKDDSILLPPGRHTVSGYCYWRLRSLSSTDDDLFEPAILQINAEPDHVYTVQVRIDQYKARCELIVIKKQLAVGERKQR